MTFQPGPSHFGHSGFNDLVHLVASTPSRLVALPSKSKVLVATPSGYAPNSRKQTRKGPIDEDGLIGVRYEEIKARPNIDSNNPRTKVKKSPMDIRASRGIGSGRGGRAGGMAGGMAGGRVGLTGGRDEWKSGELLRRKVDKRTISSPTDFRHIFHASTFEEATELLLRWAIEGVGDKLGDPSWAYPIKELVKARALDQQARAVAAVVDATIRSRLLGPLAHPALQRPGELYVVNGLPSSIYSTANTITSPLLTGTRLNNASVSPLIARASTPNLIANLGQDNYFERLPSGLKTPTSPLVNPFATPVMEGRTPQPIMHAKIAQPILPKTKTTQPLQIRKRSVAPPIAHIEDAELEIVSKEILVLTSRDKPPISAEITTENAIRELPFRVVKPMLPTLEKAMSVALFFEQYYHALLKPPTKAQSNAAHPGNYVLNRARRLASLEATFHLPENRFMSEGEKDSRREELMQEENRMLRDRRRKVDVKAFELGRVIGHGAFGVVRIGRERQTGRLVAMKQLRKSDMLRKSQEGHVKAEKDLLAAAASQSMCTGNSTSWIVQLFYAFQDSDHLYLVLEYMGGGDLLNLLVERDTFPETMTRFYVAEMILALEETHTLGYIHRDIKPDNFLFTPEGHIRVSDFGLATDLHWAHDSNYYEQQRQALLKKHGVHLEIGEGKKTKRMNKADVERIMGKEWLEEGNGVLTWRDKNRRKLAYSVCGTNSYMAPEVIRGQGYGFSCDWWSLGVIMYESLYGHPPFVSSSRHITRQKILNWKSTLKFPPKPRLTAQCTDLMTKLLCEPEDRLGSQPGIKPSILSIRSVRGQSGSEGLGSDGAEQIKAHPWFEGIHWEGLRNTTPPYQPNLLADDDTRHFDDDIPNEPLAPANGAAGDASKDPLLLDKTHGAHLLEIRKDLAFKGWTFKAPQPETRYGHLDHLSSIDNAQHTRDSSEETIAPAKPAFEVGVGMGTVRLRALSM